MIINGLLDSRRLKAALGLVDTAALCVQHFRHDSPLAVSFSWLLLGAGKPPSWRFSHFWGAAITPGPAS